MARQKIKSATDQRPFIMIYQDFLESDLLDNNYQKLVYIYLKKFADSKNQCFPSVKTLSKLTKISVNKVKITLGELEEKGVITKENRTRPDGGKSSNLYTLYDCRELWNAGSGEEMAAVIDEIEEKRMIEALTAKGYYIKKEKGLETEPTKAQYQAPIKNNICIEKDSTDTVKSQAERYAIEDVKALYDYSSLIIQHPDKQTDIDVVFDILYEVLNSTKKTIRIGGEDKPTMVVIGKLMKLQPDDLIYSIEKYHEQDHRIKNVKGYLLTILYGSREQSHLDLMNEGHTNHDF